MNAAPQKKDAKLKVTPYDIGCFVVIAAGCVAAKYGFDDLSISNPNPPEWYSIFLFGAGCFAALFGFLGLLFPGVRQFFSGRKGI